MNLFNTERRPLWIALILTLLGWAMAFLPFPTDYLHDSFHFGEYFAAQASLATGQAPFPLVIHGLLDILPASFWSALTPGHDFFPTWLTYRLLELLAALLGVLSLWVLGAGRFPAWFYLAAFGLSACLGYRDVLLVGATVTFLLLLRRSQPATDWKLPTLFVALVTANLFWSLDRGLVGLGALLLPYIADVFWVRPSRAGQKALLTLPVTGALLGLFFTPGQYLENVMVMVRTSAQWRFHTSNAGQLQVLFSALTLTFIGLLLLSVRAGGWQRLPLLKAVSITILTLMMTRLAINRADVFHLASVVWPLMLVGLSFQWTSVDRRLFSLSALRLPALCLLLIIIIYRKTVGLNPLPLLLGDPIGPGYLAGLLSLALVPNLLPSRTQLSELIKRLTLAVVIALTSLNVARVVHGNNGNFSWTAHLMDWPADRTWVDPDTQVTAARIAPLPPGCLLDMTNNGLLLALSGRPACSRFTYLVYANQSYETELLDTIKAKQPPFIVYSSPHWAYRIDGRPMSERLPALNRYLLQAYPVQQCRRGICLRFKVAP